jgi:D-psicose/D-tagatose/L-ribulose 3-epimerase
MKFAACNEFFEGWPPERVFDYCKAIGYDGVEIAPFTLADAVEQVSARRREEIRKAASDAGIEIVGLHWLLVKPEGLYINHPDAAIRRRTQDYMKALIHFCGDLGATVMIHGSPKQRTALEGWNLDEVWKRTVETFSACMDTAKERGVTYCIEPLSASNTNFINSVADALRLVRAVNHPNFETMVDCCSGSTEDKPLPDLFRQACPHMRHVHVNDPNGRGPDFGDLKFGPILRALRDLNYDRYVSLEVFDFKPDPQTIASRSLGYLKGLLENLI